jgi:ferredoxin-thioredoxin reductase catalytic chain
MANLDELYGKLDREARESGYRLNPDREFTRELVDGLIVNTGRYGYPSCPCRLATGDRDRDLDIICPCDYRDPDLSEYGSCYCALYVSEEIAEGKAEAGSIPERRPPVEERTVNPAGAGKAPAGGLSHPVWRCSVCGYLCARDEPPERCPVCKVDRDRFRRFM